MKLFDKEIIVFHSRRIRVLVNLGSSTGGLRIKIVSLKELRYGILSYFGHIKNYLQN